MAGDKKKCSFLPRIKADNLLLFLMILSVAVGIALGAGLKAGNRQYTAREISYIGFPGTVFLNMLKMLILPLIVSSLVNSLARLNGQTAGRLGYLTALFFFITTLIAVIEGIVLVVSIRPGRFAQQTDDVTQTICEAQPVDTILDLFRNLFPDNLVQACVSSAKTCIVRKTTTVTHTVVNSTIPPDFIGSTTAAPFSNWTWSENVTTEAPVVHMESGINILGLVMFSVALGIVISMMKEAGRPLADFFAALEGATMKLVTIVIWYGPIGIVFLVAVRIVEMDNPAAQMAALGMYIVTVMSGLAIHGFVVLPIFYIIIVRKNPFKHYVGITEALVTALGTSSSSATLPVSIRCMEEKNHCDSRVARFVLPLGATVNMNGSALYEAVASIYISQVLQKDLGIGQIILVSITATLAAIGAAGIPQAGLVTLLMVLVAVDLPPQYSALIIPVDWFLDRFRTSVNVLGDTVGAAVINKICQKELLQIEAQQETVEAAELRTDKTNGHANVAFNAEESHM